MVPRGAEWGVGVRVVIVLDAAELPACFHRPSTAGTPRWALLEREARSIVMADESELGSSLVVVRWVSGIRAIVGIVGQRGALTYVARCTCCSPTEVATARARSLGARYYTLTDSVVGAPPRSARCGEEEPASPLTGQVSRRSERTLGPLGR